MRKAHKLHEKRKQRRFGTKGYKTPVYTPKFFIEKGYKIARLNLLAPELVQMIRRKRTVSLEGTKHKITYRQIGDRILRLEEGKQEPTHIFSLSGKLLAVYSPRKKIKKPLKKPVF